MSDETTDVGHKTYCLMAVTESVIQMEICTVAHTLASVDQSIFIVVRTALTTKLNKVKRKSLSKWKDSDCTILSSTHFLTEFKGTTVTTENDKDGIEKEGVCVDSNGNAPTEGIVNLGSKSNKEDCWDECKEDERATGCEWSDPMCKRHTQRVVDGQGTSPSICLYFGN